MNVKIKSLDWSNVRFVAKKDSAFMEGEQVECTFVCGTPLVYDKVEKNYGLFSGTTNTSSFKEDESCPFNEFDIYLHDICVNDMTYLELIRSL